QTLQKESRLASASAPAPFDASRLRFSMWTLRFVQFSRNILLKTTSLLYYLYFFIVKHFLSTSFRNFFGCGDVS
ncbi:hypothetical protein ABEV38_14920, partial [Parageobacillus thermoglucosidasius]|uniref:hypothetical protein n=1 Tax=Parageobacillus thermoglucosidasius TaxID=1426 RepID=UPI003D2DD855